jgi:hypothetical protein
MGIGARGGVVSVTGGADAVVATGVAAGAGAADGWTAVRWAAQPAAAKAAAKAAANPKTVMVLTGRIATSPKKTSTTPRGITTISLGPAGHDTETTKPRHKCETDSARSRSPIRTSTTTHNWKPMARRHGRNACDNAGLTTAQDGATQLRSDGLTGSSAPPPIPGDAPG